MNVISEILSHIWAALGILLTIYCYVVIRKSRFVVVNELNFDVVNKPKNIDIKFEHCPVQSNIRYYKFLICYSGVIDIKEEDITVPITIKNNDETSRFHNVRIVQTSRTFKPQVKWHKNEITISSPMIKVGDTVMLEFYLESNHNDPYFFQRIQNVEIKPKIRFNHSGLLFASVSIFMMFFLFVYLINTTWKRYRKQQLSEDQFKVEYVFRGYKISEDSNFRTDLKADSLYKDNFLKNYRLMNQKDDSLARIGSLNAKVSLIEKDFEEFRRFIILQENAMLEGPSLMAEQIFKKAKEKKEIPFGKELTVSNDLKLKFTDPREENWLDIILQSIPIIFFSLMSFLCLFVSAFYGIQYWSIKRAHIYLKK